MRAPRRSVTEPVADITDPDGPPLARSRARLPGAWALLGAGYAVAVYLLFLAVLWDTIGFLADRGVPRAVDGPAGPVLPAAAADVALLSLFAVQHSVMARPWFKRRWTRVVPEPVERTTFVLCSALVLALLCWQWRPIGPTVWNLTGIAGGAMLGVYVAGWVIVLGSSFLVSHFDLLGLRQAYRYVRRAAYTAPSFTRRGLYRLIRHPLMAGFVIVFWAAPRMTAGHLLFAAAATGYILVGIRFEEHDLERQLGGAYRDYRASVPALVPMPRRGRREPDRLAAPDG
jgi:methanethiol S-methyltransferase